LGGEGGGGVGVREGAGQGGEMTQALYAHMNNKRKKSKIYQKKRKDKLLFAIYKRHT
jgi:hypothetical protein